MKSAITVLLLLAPLLARDDEPQAGHSLHGEEFNEGPRQQAYLIAGMGHVSFAVTTRIPAAQEFFTQGIAQLHSFYYFEAERSFRQAASLDPDLALAYWGMAMANVNNEKRAKEFLARAEKLKGQAGPREHLWIRFLTEWYQHPSGEKRARAAIKALETIVSDYPDDAEAKAFLVWACFHFSDKGLPISSHTAIDSIIADVLRANPMHPGAHHYRIHLWDTEKAERGLISAGLFGPSAPGIAHAWHMPGHIYTKLHRYDDAARQQEASARVDHAQMIRDRTMPYQIHNYVHNNQWCMQDLMYIGRIRDAAAIGENLIAIPRHPALNKLEDSSHACREGRSRLFEVLARWELWEPLLGRAKTILAPCGIDDDELKRLRALGAAYFSTQDRENGERCIAGLEALETKERDKPLEKVQTRDAQNEGKKDEKKEDKKDDPKKNLKRFQNALGELRGRRAWAHDDPKGAVEQFLACEDLPQEILARAYLRDGDLDKAETTARKSAEAAEGQAVPWASYTEVLAALGKKGEAEAAWRKTAPLVRQADPGLPILQRLEHLSASLKIDPAPEKIALEHPDTLGPLAWKPPPAPARILTAEEGHPLALGNRPGSPVLVLFYLGARCTHCVQQLDLFRERAEDFRRTQIGVVAVSSETSESLAAQRGTKARDPFPFPIIADPSLQIFKEYRCYDDFEKMALHGTFLLDTGPDGERRIRWQEISYDPFMDASFLLKECRRLLSLP